MHGRHTPPSPLERGGWGGGFLKSMTGFSGLSPERRYSDKQITCMSYISAPL